MGAVEERLKAKREMTPSAGANLVGVDTFEREPGLELYIISEHGSEAEAKKAQAARKKAHPDEVTHIYTPG